ncbi:MAG: AMP-binding protein, partial [Acidimicrobiales bacterium]
MATATIYDECYRRALSDPEGFWAAAAEDIHWERRWDRVLDAARPPYYRWFAGGTLNTCYNALDLHIDRGRGKQLALIHDSPVTQTARTFTYLALRDEVARFAGALRRQGVERGDRVIIYMPMVPEAVIAMLACARIGAIHSVVFGGFSAESLRDRINDSQVKVLITADGGYRRGSAFGLKSAVDEARTKTDKVDHVLVVRRTGQDV